MAPSRRRGNNDNNNNENPDIAAIIAQQLQTILPQIVTQVTNNVNNANNGNGGNGGGGNGNGGNNGCTFKAFQSCNPKEYDGKGGAIVLTRWIEKMENVIDNSGCAENQKATMAMTWNDFKAVMVEEFCPSNEMKKLENEFWNHKMVGANHAAYTDRFHELAKLVPHLVTPESSRIKRYIAGLAPEIRGMLRATQPTTIQNAILRAGILTDEAISCGTLTKGNDKRKVVEESGKSGGSWKDNKKAKVGTWFVAIAPPRNEVKNSNPKCSKCNTHHLEGKIAEDTNDKRKWKDDHKGSSSQQQNKEPKAIKAHAVGPSNKKGYAGKQPLCNKCMFHHTGLCAGKVGNCKRLGHQTRHCRTPVLRVKQSPSMTKQKAKVICYKCGILGHFKSDCSKWKFQKRVNEYQKEKALRGSSVVANNVHA
ncbi:reverse transcriptase domain-containing protein [Tanacetum coccineum]